MKIYDVEGARTTINIYLNRAFPLPSCRLQCRAECVAPRIIQGAARREKAFVDIKVGSFGYQLGCRTATVTAPQQTEGTINNKQINFHNNTPHPVHI